MRYDMLLRTSEKDTEEEKLNAYFAANPSAGTSRILTVAASKEVKLVRAQTNEAKRIIARISEEDEKLRKEIDEGISSRNIPM